MRGNRRVAVIENARAGRPRGALEPARLLDRWPVDFLRPTSAGELTAMCAALSPQRYAAALVVGGDGTQNAAIRGLLHSRVPLLPFPAGTANDLSSDLGISADWDRVCAMLERRRVVARDLIEVNGVPVATVGGVGLGATVVDQYNAGRERSPLMRLLAGTLSSHIYSALCAKALLVDADYFQQLLLESPGLEQAVDAITVLVCLQATLGDHLTLVSAAPRPAGHFQVFVLPGRRRLLGLRQLLALRRGLAAPEASSFFTAELCLRERSGRPLRVFGDGDVLLEAERLVFRALPRALLVYQDLERDFLSSNSDPASAVEVCA